MEKIKCTYKEYVIAVACHQANRVYCESLGDWCHEDFQELKRWHVESIIKGVKFNLKYPNAIAAYSHNCWLENRKKLGWTFGQTLDEKEKRHPMMMRFDELQPSEQKKSIMFKAIVNSLA